jgi:hypothetical protein
MRRPNLSLPLLTALLLGGVSAGCPVHTIGPDTRTGADRQPPTTDRPTGPRSAVAKRALETICDRMEDCAIERNVGLARTFGGNKTDLEAARLQARVALHSGYVRRWWLMRLSGLSASKLLQIHKCLARTACDPFYRCAEKARNAGTNHRTPPSARTP